MNTSDLIGLIPLWGLPVPAHSRSEHIHRSVLHLLHSVGSLKAAVAVGYKDVSIPRYADHLLRIALSAKSGPEWADALIKHVDDGIAQLCQLRQKHIYVFFAM